MKSLNFVEVTHRTVDVFMLPDLKPRVAKLVPPVVRQVPLVVRLSQQEARVVPRASESLAQLLEPLVQALPIPLVLLVALALLDHRQD